MDAVIAPIPDGWHGIFPGHARFSARLMAGTVIVRIGTVERQVATIGGVLTVEGDTVSILTGAAQVDRGLDELELGLREHIERLIATEKEAEKHFSRVYHQMAHAFDRTGRHA